jgi:archaeal cell division control protein 6
MGIVEDELGRSGVFADRSVLDFNWVPDRLPHRDAEMRALTALFRPVADQSVSQSAFVTGHVGSGKTVLTKRFATEFKDAAAKRQQNVEHVHVNCRRNASEGLVLQEILHRFDPKYPERGFSTNEMMRDLRKHLDRRGCHVIVTLDEADALIAKEGSDLVYSLSRFDDERTSPKATLSLLLVSARADLPFMLDEASRSTVRRSNVVELAKYNATQLLDILQDRAKRAFHRGVVEDEVLDLISEIAAEEGDARYAIELLDHAGRNADEEGSDTVEAEHVRAAKAYTRSFATVSKMQLLSLHPQLALKGIARKMSRGKGRTYLTTGEAEEAYALACEEHDESPRAHTQFWKYLKELETAGWIRLKAAPRSEASGNTQYISLPDVPAKILIAKLDESLASARKKPA